MEFDNLDKLFRYIEKQTAKALEDDVAKAAKQVHKEVIEEEVYDWEPEEYERRGEHGGMLDTRNYIAKLRDAPLIENHILDFANMTPYSKKYWREKMGYLADLINWGDGANGAHYDYPATDYDFKRPRAIYAPTIERLEAKIAAQALKAGLKKRGIDTE